MKVILSTFSSNPSYHYFFDGALASLFASFKFNAVVLVFVSSTTGSTFPQPSFMAQNSKCFSVNKLLKHLLHHPCLN